MTDEDTEGEKLPTEEERESDLGSDTEELPRRSVFMRREKHGDFASLVILCRILVRQNSTDIGSYT